MAAYSKPSLPSIPGYDQARYQDATLEPYQQPFPPHQGDKFAQLNQQSFASNNAVASYMPTGLAVVSCQPSTGMYGEKVYLKVSAQYDLFPMSTPMPYFFLQFGTQKCPMQDVARDTHDTSAFVYSCSADVPQFLATGCSSSNVPMALVVEGPSGDEISRTSAGSFQYMEGSADSRSDKMTKMDPGPPPPGSVAEDGPSPKSGDPPQIDTTTATNGYDYSTSTGAAYAHAAFAPSSATDSMISYRSSSFGDPSGYGQRRSMGWNGFNTPLGSTAAGVGRTGSIGSSLDAVSGGAGGRGSLTPISMPTPSTTKAPSLIRTSTIVSSAGGGVGGAGSYASMSLFSAKAVLKIVGNLDSMVDGWTQEEWESRRRIVVFKKTQSGSTLTVQFRPVPVNERPSNSICVSCIYWAERNECYVTSVDTIQLLEQLLAAPDRFTVEEKNRIRRNLEGFHPLTVSKAKPDSEEFFKLIMGFPNPKPRNIEKDVKVFPWKVLEGALKKIIGKYSANPGTGQGSNHVVVGAAGGNASSMNPTPYATLPTPPTQHHHMASHHGSAADAHGQYSMHSSNPHHQQQHHHHHHQSSSSHHHQSHSHPHQHQDSMPSPRSLFGSQASWAPYSTSSAYPSTRAMSPVGLRNHSPQQQQQQSHQHSHHHQPPPPPMRINTSILPAVSPSTYDSRTVSTGSYGSSNGGGLHTPISHNPSTATPPRWDPAAAAAAAAASHSGYAAADGYSSGLSSQHAQAGPSLYNGSTYGDGPSRG